ncbi:hypothetical protein BJ138DRAFT_1137883 [Hygrophoropsis aurantiaca]|uniref:Uncharacterized protein n=1 Tax=Hygrophoropsis aurantiaca TaxID=72124 RepID=A0ACB8A256_9AGAM|nr:hypothetical protein BJ138DRAFT_1137883 [Hygrophoropsis aurantiaca]
MIAKCRAKSWIIHLKEEGGEEIAPNSQRGMKGHVIVYPQQPSAIADILPPSLQDVTTPICVLFVGSRPPTTEWLRSNARPLIVRKERVRSALLWLKANNHHYKEISINDEMLNSLEDEQLLPVHIEHVLPSHAEESLTSRYDGSSTLMEAAPASSPEDNGEAIAFQNVVVTDVDGKASPAQLRAAALRHVKSKGGGYLQIPCGSEPVNEFMNPGLMPMIYPTLFPYGLGGFENPRRSEKLSMKRQLKHFVERPFFTPVSKSNDRILMLLPMTSRMSALPPYML